MTDAATRKGDAVPSRARLAAVIPHRPKVTWVTALLLAAGFALVVTPVIRLDAWLGGLDIRAGEPAPVTVRVPEFTGLTTPEAVVAGGSLVVVHGEVPDVARAALATAAQAAQPRGPSGFLAYFAVVLMLSGLYTHHMRRSHRGRLLRVQLVHLGVLAATAAVVKILLLLTSISVLVVPVALAAAVPTLVFDRIVGLATGVLTAIIVSLLVPFDVGIATVLVVQVAVAGVLIPEHTRPRWRVAALGSLVGAATGAIVYGVVHLLSIGQAPVHQLVDPVSSSWMAAAVGGLLAGALTVPLTALYQVLVGEIPLATLVQLEDLSHPLLRQIAEKAPGTWQHSLAMANMAEIAANAIAASGRLVRVGAYFHDLGKSLQPKYFIENLEAGESSPHDRLPPEVSCDAIFAHVTEGIAVARRAKLPERIIDFMHMHHGDGVLEYFWAKCKDQGNPKGLTVENFRYPGVPPQSRETAILAICDAVEAASRTLKRPDDPAIASLVQRIVYGKLHLGQLDESGLSMADLRKISDSLRETIKHAHHGRIEYPWQRAERAERQAEGEHLTPATVGMRAGNADDGVPSTIPRATTTTQRIMEEPRLDSLDVPRPIGWRSRDERPRADSMDAGVATTDLLGATAATALSIARPEAAPDATRSLARDAGRAPVAEVHLDEPSVHRKPTRPLPEEAVGEAPFRAPTRLVSADDEEVESLRKQSRATTAEIDALAAVITGPQTGPAPAGEPVAAPSAPSAVPPAPSSPVPAVVPPRPKTPSGGIAMPGADERSGKRRTAPPPPPPGSSPGMVLPPIPEPAPRATPTAFPTPNPPVVPAHAASPTPSPAPAERAATVEVDGDAVEAVIDLQPSVHAGTTGPIIGPPPATRKPRSGTVPRLATDDDSRDNEPTEAASMLPPRSGGAKPPSK